MAHKPNPGRAPLGRKESKTQVTLQQKMRAANELKRKAEARGQKMSLAEALKRIDRAAQEREFNVRQRAKRRRES